MLYRELFLVCSNGSIPNLKLVSALQNLHKTSAIFHSKDSPHNWCPDTGGILRMMAKHWRDIAMFEDKLDICLRKAWGLQTKNRLCHFSKDFRALGSVGFRGE